MRRRPFTASWLFERTVSFAVLSGTAYETITYCYGGEEALPVVIMDAYLNTSHPLSDAWTDWYFLPPSLRDFILTSEKMQIEIHAGRNIAH